MSHAWDTACLMRETLHFSLLDHVSHVALRRIFKCRFFRSSLLYSAETWDDGLSITNSNTLSMVSGSVTNYGQIWAICARFQFVADFCFFVVVFQFYDLFRACLISETFGPLIPNNMSCFIYETAVSQYATRFPSAKVLQPAKKKVKCKQNY